MAIGRHLYRILKALRASKRGNIAVLSGLAIIPLAIGIVMAVETSAISNERATLQAAVDAGALAGANELSVASRGTDGIIATAKAVGNQGVTGLSQRMTVGFTVNVERAIGAVTMEGRATRPSSLGFMGAGQTELFATATAETLQDAPLCILQTGRDNIANVKIDDNGKITALGCLIHANRDIDVLSNASIQAGRVQAVGKAEGNISPAGNSGALAIEDPFASMDLNPPTACSGKAKELKATGKEVMSLAPGVHCNEIKIAGNATLKLEAGEHYFMEEIEFKGNAKLRGEDVVLIFDNDDSFTFGEKADVELSARRTGIFAGFLIITSRLNDEVFTISSDKVRELLGTIYIPEAELMITTAGSVAQDSAWSVIVARALHLKENPNLVINTNYVASGVPVPVGVGPAGGAPRLSK